MKRVTVLLLAAGFVVALIPTFLAAFNNDQPAPTLGHARIADSVPPVNVWSATPPPPTTTSAVVVVAASPVKAARAVVVPVGDLQDLIRREFARFGPHVAEEAVRVGGCESTGDETGNNIDPNATGSEGEVGIFQIHPRYHAARAAKFGWAIADLYDPAKNVVVAADLYAEQGWGPWTCEYAA